jgi:putative flippase GtrA
MASSLIAAGIDLVVFAIVFWATSNVLTSMIAGRVSSLANFALNRRFVFNSGGNVAASLTKYYAVVAVIGVTAYYCVTLLSQAGINVLLAKIATETGLWLVSFAAQRTFVFGVKPESGRK